MQLVPEKILQFPRVQEWIRKATLALNGLLLHIETYSTYTGNTTLTTNDDIVKVVGSVTITLPSAVGITGKVYSIDSTTGNVTVDPAGSETIEGETSQVVPANCCMSIYSDGANWRIK
jgi:hypothetical protein